ncbi:MAG: nuclear transport factor 2 family protein [Cyanobacteria bacterium J06642_9]
MKATLMALEADFWQASSDGDAYTIASLLTDDACLVGNFGTLDKNATVEINRQGQGGFVFWRVEGESQLVQLTPESAVVYYKATAQRPKQEPFTILMSSTYTLRYGQWQLTFHHQTLL